MIKILLIMSCLIFMGMARPMDKDSKEMAESNIAAELRKKFPALNDDQVKAVEAAKVQQETEKGAAIAKLLSASSATIKLNEIEMEEARSKIPKTDLKKILKGNRQLKKEFFINDNSELFMRLFRTCSEDTLLELKRSFLPKYGEKTVGSLREPGNFNDEALELRDDDVVLQRRKDKTVYVALEQAEKDTLRRLKLKKLRCIKMFALWQHPKDRFGQKIGLPSSCFSQKELAIFDSMDPRIKHLLMKMNTALMALHTQKEDVEPQNATAVVDEVVAPKADLYKSTKPKARKMVESQKTAVAVPSATASASASASASGSGSAAAGTANDAQDSSMGERAAKKIRTEAIEVSDED